MNKVRIIVFVATFASIAGVNAATLMIGPRSVQEVVVKSVFTDQGRWNLLSGACFARLDSPRTSLAQGRVVVEAHLSAQLGAPMSGSCVGSAFDSKVVVSGKLVGAGTTLTLTEIRFDRVDDEATRSALELLQSVAPTSLPPFDLLAAIRAQKPKVDELPIDVDKLHIDEVATTDTAVTVRFDFALRGP